MLEIFDTDQNGELDFEEFCLMADAHKTKLTRNELKGFFDELDENKNGSIVTTGEPKAAHVRPLVNCTVLLILAWQDMGEILTAMQTVRFPATVFELYTSACKSVISERLGRDWKGAQPGLLGRPTSG